MSSLKVSNKIRRTILRSMNKTKFENLDYKRNVDNEEYRFRKHYLVVENIPVNFTYIITYFDEGKIDFEIEVMKEISKTKELKDEIELFNKKETILKACLVSKEDNTLLVFRSSLVSKNGKGVKKFLNKCIVEALETLFKLEETKNILREAKII